MSETEPTGTAEAPSGPFHTPSWVRQRPGEHDQDPGPLLPAQSAPRHDRVASVPDAPSVPLRASWGAHSDTGMLGAVVALAAALLTVIGVVIAAIMRTPASLVLPAVAATALVLVRSQLAAGGGGRTTLERSLLEVTTRQGARRFDLAVPEIGVAMSESDDDPRWQLILDDHQFRPVVLTARQVPPRELGPIVRHYRRIAEKRAADRGFTLEG